MFHPIEAGATGTLRDPVPRLGLEKALPDIAEIAGWVTDPPELAGRLAALFHEWQRAHEVGAGFGGEFAEGLMLASWGVNQEAQNRGIEKFLRAAHDREFRADVTIKASGRRLAIPLADGGYEYVDVLTSVVYGVHAKGGKTVPFGITMEPSGRWHVTHRLPAGTPGADVRTRGTR
jgi:hypothetical protein